MTRSVLVRLQNGLGIPGTHPYVVLEAAVSSSGRAVVAAAVDELRSRSPLWLAVIPRVVGSSRVVVWTSCGRGRHR